MFPVNLYCLPCGKCMSLGVFNVDYVKGSWMSLSVNHCAHTPQVTPSSYHAQITYSGGKNWKNVNTQGSSMYKQNDIRLLIHPVIAYEIF